MSPSSRDMLEFGEFQLDVAERRLLRNGQPLSLPPKLFDLLALLAQNPGKLMDKDQLLEKLWPGTHVEESNLSVNVSALRRALGEGAAFIETVPKRGYRFVGAVQTMPSALAPSAAVSPAPASPRRRLVLTLSFGSILLSAIALWLIVPKRAGTSAVKSVAVFPFATLAADDSQAYLGLGMADAIITRLSVPNRIDVRPTSAVTRYTGNQVNFDQAARDLHVDAAVEGRIQMVNDRIRVTVQLHRVSDGKQLFAEAFDDYFSNVFAVQDEIAAKIASALTMKLSDAERSQMAQHGPADPEAYRLFLQGQYQASRRMNDATLDAIAFFERAIAKDPTYAAPYAALAYSYAIRAGEGLNDELREKAKPAALKALALDNKLPDAYFALGQVLLRSEWDWAGAERAFRQAIEIDPKSAPAHAALATVHTAQLRHSEAIREMELACRLDPTSASLRSDLAWTLLFDARYSDSIQESKRAVLIDDSSYSAHRQLSKAFLLAGYFEPARAEAERTLIINGGRRRRVLAEVAAADAAAGHRDEAERKLQTLEQGQWTEPLPHYEMAVLYLKLGRRSDALASLEAAVDHRLSRVLWMNSDPELKSLHDEPRFQALLQRLGLQRAGVTAGSGRN